MASLMRDPLLHISVKSRSGLAWVSIPVLANPLTSPVLEMLLITPFYRRGHQGMRGDFLKSHQEMQLHMDAGHLLLSSVAAHGPVLMI